MNDASFEQYAKETILRILDFGSRSAICNHAVIVVIV